jgi:hypothetical protein
MVPGTFNRYNSEQMELLISQFAIKIQRVWTLERHRRGLSRLKKTLQASQRRLIDSLKKKAHPELPSQGVEYSWGFAKLYFRKIKTALSAKEKAQQQLVASNVLLVASIDGEQSLNLEHSRKFVRKARDYKMVYRKHFKTLYLKKSQAEMATNETAESAKKHHYVTIEKQVRDLKSHRATADIDTKFI